MSLEQNKSNYSKLAKYFHWSFVIIFIFGVAKQVENLNQLEDISFLRFEIIFAIFFLIFLAIRFIYMKKTQNTSLPYDTPRAQKIAVKIVHNGMYLLLAGTAMSGLIIGILYWVGIKDGIYINISIIIHEFIVNSLYWLIGLHVIAACYHRLKKDGVWSSMVPLCKEFKK